MTKESPELVAVVSRWIDAVQAKDKSVLTNLFSSSEHLRYIGSDVNEIWSGGLVREAYGDHVAEVVHFTFDCTHVNEFNLDRPLFVVLRGIEGKHPVSTLNWK